MLQDVSRVDIDLVFMHLVLEVSITLVSGPQLLHVPDIVCELCFNFSYGLLEVISERSDFFFETLNDPLLIEFIILFNLTQLSFDDGDSLFNLVVGDLGYEGLHLFFYFTHQLALLLPVERRRLAHREHHRWHHWHITTTFTSSGCSSSSTGGTSLRLHLLHKHHHLLLHILRVHTSVRWEQALEFALLLGRVLVIFRLSVIHVTSSSRVG